MSEERCAECQREVRNELQRERMYSVKVEARLQAIEALVAGREAGVGEGRTWRLIEQKNTSGESRAR